MTRLSLAAVSADRSLISVWRKQTRRCNARKRARRNGNILFSSTSAASAKAPRHRRRPRVLAPATRLSVRDG